MSFLSIGLHLVCLGRDSVLLPVDSLGGSYQQFAEPINRRPEAIDSLLWVRQLSIVLGATIGHFCWFF